MNSFFHVSERNHSGLILMTELAAQYQSDAFTSLQDIAESMHISLGYLEEIAAALKGAGLIEGRKGRSGGYRLTRAPSKITTDQILTALEGPLALVACQKNDAQCPAENGCKSRSLWHLLQTNILSTLRQTTLADLIRQPSFV